MDKETSFFHKNPVKIFLLAFLLLLFTELTLRVVLYLKGYEVGVLTPYWNGFHEVDSLEVTPQFFTDGFGIYKAKREYWEPQGIYINNENFRGREFDAIPDSGRLKLLEIGDSFTWGYHAEPFDSCFVDLLNNSTAFSCYNAGIPGADPAQYLQVARIYVPVIKPDYIIVNFYLANDLMSEPRKIRPGVDLYYQTNTGWLPAFYKHHYFSSAEASYNFIRAKYTVKGWGKKLFVKTAIGTTLLALPLRFEEYFSWKAEKKNDVPNQYLKSIREICQEHHCHFLIFVIPNSYADLNADFNKDRRAYVFENYPRLFEGLEGQTFILPMEEADFFPMPDGHFNNRGHRVAADFMKSVISDSIRKSE